MLKHAITAIELLCLVGAVALAVLWVAHPSGSYEPWVALCGAVAIVLDIVRRALRSQKLRVFLSVGSTYTDDQELFVNTLERLLEEQGCERLVVGRDSPASRQPILQIRDLMRKADAVLVVAFTRYVIKKAIEKPGAKDPRDTTELRRLRYPTVWNQIEAGIAFGLKRPLLVFVEEGIKQQAMLKDRLEFRAIVKPLRTEVLRGEEFPKILADFISIARRRSWLRL